MKRNFGLERQASERQSTVSEHFKSNKYFLSLVVYTREIHTKHFDKDPCLLSKSSSEEPYIVRGFNVFRTLGCSFQFLYDSLIHAVFE